MGKKALCFFSWTLLLTSRGNGDRAILPGALLATQCQTAAGGREGWRQACTLWAAPLPGRAGRAVRAHAPMPAPTVQNAIPPAHWAGFSSPCFRFEGKNTLMLEIQHSWGGKPHPFLVKEDGEGKSIPPLPQWSPAITWHRLGGRLSPSQTMGFTWLQVWPNCKTTGTSGEPPIALETFP